MHLLTLTNDTALREELRATLGEDACEFHSPDASAQQIEQALIRNPDAVLLDLKGVADAGAAFLAGWKQRNESIPLLVVCSQSDRESGLRAIRAGAQDYLLRPISMDELGARLSRTQESEHLRREAGALRVALERSSARTAFIAESESMLKVRDGVAALAGGHEPVLFVGEAGTGKKTLAEFLHRLDAPRRTPPGILNCAAHGASLLDSAAWQEARESGTVILVGPEALPRDQQERLATMLGTNGAKRPVRVVAVTRERVDQDGHQAFAPVLAQRFQPFTFVLPPLRERGGDIPALLAHFAQRTAQRIGRPVSVSPRALAMLAAYSWPGNVGELESAVERAALLGGNGRLEYADFGLVPGLSSPGEASTGALELKPQVEAFERQVIIQALQAAKGNRQAAARLLGVSLRTLFYKIKRYGVD